MIKNNHNFIREVLPRGYSWTDLTQEKAQKLKPIDAAIVGVYIHGLAGDIASSVLSEYSVMASDVINYLPFAIKKIIAEE